jgi:hypothetical protein
MFVLDIMFAANGESIDYTSFWEGFPVSSRIRYIWLRVDVPGKSDLPVIN